MTLLSATANKTEVPFRLVGDAQPLMLIPVSVNGSGPFQFIFDTGAGTTLLARGLAAQLELTPTGSKQGHTAGGAVDVKLAMADTIAVGELNVENVAVAMVDLSPLARAVGAPIDGDLGHNFFGVMRVTIDYRRKLLRLDDPRRCDYFGVAALTEVQAKIAHPANPLLLVEAHVNGQGPFRYAIDTGTSTTTIAEELAQELQLRTFAWGSVTTGGSPITMRAARLDSLRIGSCEVGEFNVMVGGFLRMLSDAVGAKLDGIVGFDFLRNYKVVIDYPNSSFSLFSA